MLWRASAFLITAMLFLYGMARYFFDAYKLAPFGEGYSWQLFIDSLVFTTEALFFFVMSRSLLPSRSLAFATAAFCIFLVDFLWVLKCTLWGLPSGARFEAWWIRHFRE